MPFFAAFRGGATCLVDTQLRIIIIGYPRTTYYKYVLGDVCAIDCFAANSSTPSGQRIGLLEPPRQARHPSYGERVIGVGSQLGKLLAPEGRPVSRLLPGVADRERGREA